MTLIPVLTMTFKVPKVDGFVKSLNSLSFRVKREIFRSSHIEKIRFLPVVEMTDSLSLTFYETVKVREFWIEGSLRVTGIKYSVTRTKPTNSLLPHSLIFSPTCAKEGAV